MTIRCLIAACLKGASLIIVIGGLGLSGCGRAGPPEPASALVEPAPAPAADKQAVPGLNVLQKPKAATPAVKPKGTFILDPIL